MVPGLELDMHGSFVALRRGIRLLFRPRDVFGLCRVAVSAVATSARTKGWRATAGKLLDAPRRPGLRAIARRIRDQYVQSFHPRLRYPEYDKPVTRAAAATMQPRVLIVAELSLPQCTKYRVTQRVEHFSSFGVPCTVLDWGDRQSVRNALPTHPVVIFYRVPGYPDVIPLIEQANRLGMSTFWEADDLIFDAEIYEANGNLHRLTPELRDGIRLGIPLYRAALQACSSAIASTEMLAAVMREVTGREAFVIENALDDETIRGAETIRLNHVRSPGSTVTLAYGSGSKAHDADFACAADGVLQVMLLRPHVRFRLIGDLSLPASFQDVADRVERKPFTDFGAYLQQVGECDISLAPLENSVFNDAKSNIKFLEAAILGRPSVCSPRAAFSQVVQHEANGLLAETPDEWTAALLRLVDDSRERARLGRAAHETARTLYDPKAVANRQIAPFVDRFLNRREAKPSRLSVVMANVFFKPQSFGGATIVAEEIARRFHARGDTDVAVFTSYGRDQASPHDLFRYEVDGVPVFAARTPPLDYRELEYSNPRMGEVFSEVLAAVQPDVVHLHSLQGLSASIGEACQAAGIPYVITLHDAWWICERQFMVQGNGRYCFQTRIDPNVCGRCVPDSWFNRHRTRQLRRVLDGAALLLTPSAFHRELHIANGVAPEKILVNRNGVRWPDPLTKRRSPAPTGMVRFGFVGGVGPVKGGELVKRAFEDIEEENYELVLVDHTLNIGFSSVDLKTWNVRGRVTRIPAYTQDTMEEFFGRIDVLLFPSQWKESFGLTVREALVRDIWVIVTDAGGASEDVVEGENGTIVPISTDHDPLKRAIVSLLRKPDRLAGFANPHKARIATFESQAVELHRFLTSVARPRDYEDGVPVPVEARELV
jgi:glycosyltransferase involved in cell wall biosynthesis